ncbi:MAG TPA: epoxyqueuosine reductase QueH [Sphaerochaeta sp.]|nr:epoxyqueuosine reductase QueH [Spirochaetales bacterium]HPK63515.1 epoxyqueuosine reductase QueH [Sphaerochaeta sp.]HRV23954.1 epoxyqueuosine reductase QueH [Sphaerochaeta sp.]
MKRRDILVHACCGPCSTSSIERMLGEGWNPVLYFSNSNIFPFEEAQKRFDELMKVAKIYELEVIREIYDHESWLKAIRGFEKEQEGGERCRNCFAYNLAEANAKAIQLGFDHFTTTLTVSRFKHSPTIFAVGKQYERFEAIDFKKQGGFERSNILSREYGLYRQQYCGCEFSIRP